MNKNWNALLIFTVIVLVAVVTVMQTLPPPPLPANAPVDKFSAERAIEHIRAIAATPRPTGSLAYKKARDYVLGELQTLGLETETQRYGYLENIVARLKGSQSSDAVLLTAHLDSVTSSPGATDDGSGVAVLLETARALTSSAPLQNTVMFLFTDAEEPGYLGAKGFIFSHPWAKDVRLVIGFDAGGISGPGVLSATSADNGWLIRQLARADSYLVGSSAINTIGVSNTDFTGSFRGAGFSGYEFDLFMDKRIHSQDDSIENINLSSIQHQGYHALSLARYLGNLKQLDDPRQPDEVFFNVLRLFTVRYSSTWAVPMAVGVSMVFISVVFHGFKRKIITWGGIGFGVINLLVGILLAPLPYVLLGKWLTGVISRVASGSLAQPMQVSLFAFLAVTLILLWYSLSRRIRRTTLPDLTIGALLPMSVGMLGSSIAFPALSYAFTWPLLFSLLACGFWFFYCKGEELSIAVVLGLLLVGAASTVILGPAIFLGLFDQAAITLVFLGVLCGFLLPLIHIMMDTSLLRSNHPSPSFDSDI